MFKRLFTVIILTYFVSIGLSPILGLHSHDHDGSHIIHAHDDTLSIKKNTSTSVLSQSEQDHAHTQALPESLLESLLLNKTNFQATVSHDINIESLDNDFIGLHDILFVKPVIQIHNLKIQVKQLISRLNSSSQSSRAPPIK